MLSPNHQKSDQCPVDRAHPGVACNETRSGLAPNEPVVQKSACRAQCDGQYASRPEGNYLRPEEFHSEIPPFMLAAVNPSFVNRAAAEMLLLPD